MRELPDWSHPPHLGNVMLLAIVGVGAVRVPDVILIHLLPAVIVPFSVPAHLTVTHQGVTWGKVSEMRTLLTIFCSEVQN